MTMCGAPVVFEISNLSLCCKTTPITSIKFECFSVVCVCFICVLKKPLWSPEAWLHLIIMVLVTLTEKAMAPHSSTLGWKISWMEEPGGLQSMGSLRVGHD